MSKKKYYFFVMPPMLIMGLFLLFYLPASQRPYVFLIPIIFWLIYYVWVFIEKKESQK